MKKSKSDPVSNIVKEGLKRVEEEQKFFENILHDLNTHPKYSDFFNRHHPDSVIRFKESFAKYKANCLLYAHSYRKMEEEEALQYRDLAINCLWEIQQKKLFTLQCRWRAGEINLEEINYGKEFERWEFRISSCPFITPVSQQEIDDYIEYLNETDSLNVFDFDPCQDYSQTTGVWVWWTNEPKLPPYFKWWYAKYGDDELHLSNTRTLQEYRFLKAAFTESIEESKKREADPSYEKRPYLSFHDNDTFLLLMEKFGDPDMVEFQKLKNEIDHLYSEWDYFDEHINLLKEAGMDWPVQHHPDWRWSLIAAGIRYKQGRVAKALPVVYHDYLFRLENGIAPEEPDYFDRGEQTEFFISKQIKDILRGMELLGETG